MSGSFWIPPLEVCLKVCYLLPESRIKYTVCLKHLSFILSLQHYILAALIENTSQLFPEWFAFMHLLLVRLYLKFKPTLVSISVFPKSCLQDMRIPPFLFSLCVSSFEMEELLLLTVKYCICLTSILCLTSIFTEPGLYFTWVLTWEKSRSQWKMGTIGSPCIQQELLCIYHMHICLMGRLSVSLVVKSVSATDSSLNYLSL